MQNYINETISSDSIDITNLKEILEHEKLKSKDETYLVINENKEEIEKKIYEKIFSNIWFKQLIFI